MCHLDLMTYWLVFIGGWKMVCRLASLTMVYMRDAAIATISSR